jgi:DNA-binding NtrC family response regulator
MPGDQSLRVLVVDDETIIADTLAMIVRGRGFKVLCAYTAEDAITVAVSFDPHALISDVVMPGLNGIDLAMHFAKHYPHCKILLMSGHAAAMDLLEMIPDRGLAPIILPKPIHPMQILEFLNTCTAA